MAKLTHRDEAENVQVATANLDHLVQIANIPEGKKWNLVTIDDQGTTTTIAFTGGTPHIGGTPDDR